MREIRVESLEKLEVTHGEVRMLANSGELSLIFPRPLFEDALAGASPTPEPISGEIEELIAIKEKLKEHARANSFAAILEDVPCGNEGAGQRFDLVLRPEGMFAATTGYLFLPVVEQEHTKLFGACMKGEHFVEQAYLVGAVAEEKALVSGGERLKALSVRGRRCSSSHFELSPELWQVLSGLGWKEVVPVAPGGGRTGALYTEEG